jgi:hypothetical protein
MNMDFVWMSDVLLEKCKGMEIYVGKIKQESNN